MKGIITANALYTYMKDTIKGQDAGLRKMAVSIASHLQKYELYKDNPSAKLWKDNVLILGPTGSGKTELFRTLSECKLIDVPMMMLNVYEFTPPAWKGERKFADCLEELCEKAGQIAQYKEDLLGRVTYKKQLIENAIVFIDEFDKRALPPIRTSDTSLEQDFQNEMLKIIEGTHVKVSDSDFDTIDTSKMLFVLLGAFESLTSERKKDRTLGFVEPVAASKDSHIKREDIVKYGFKRELMGRVPTIVEFNSLTVADLIEIMKYSKTSLIKQYAKLMEHMGVTFTIDEDAYESIAKRVLTEKSGARGLQAIMTDVLEPIMFSVMSNQEHDIHITKDLAESRESYHG